MSLSKLLARYDSSTATRTVVQAGERIEKETAGLVAQLIKHFGWTDDTVGTEDCTWRFASRWGNDVDWGIALKDAKSIRRATRVGGEIRPAYAARVVLQLALTGAMDTTGEYVTDDDDVVFVPSDSCGVIKAGTMVSVPKDR